MFGKEPYIIYQDKINFGSNMLIWRNSQETTLRQEMCLPDGWTGAQEKRLGWLSLNFKKEWDNLKTLKQYYIAISMHIHLLKHILKLLSFNSKIETKKVLVISIKELSPNQAHRPYNKLISWISLNSKSNLDNTKEQGRYSNLDLNTFLKIQQKNYTSYI